MAKHMKEFIKKKKCNIKIFLIIIVFLIIVMIPILEDNIVQKHNDELVKENKENLMTDSELENQYDIKDFQNFSFSNAEVKTENGISYINIEVKNNSSEKSQIQKIMIRLSGRTKQMKVDYILPEIANETYKMQLSVIEDLSNIEQIEIKESNNAE